MSSRRLCLPALILLAGSLCSPPLFCQNQDLGAQSGSADTASAPTFKSKVQVVLVDVVVTNSKGNPVPALEKQDFQVFEDGRPQSISFFQEHSVAPVAPVKAPPLPPNVYTNYPALKTADAVSVLLLDWLNTQPSDQAFLHRQILKFLQIAPPGTPIAIFSMGIHLRMIKGFTTDPAELLAAVEGKDSIQPRASPLLPSHAETAEQQNSIQMMRMNQASPAAIEARQEMMAATEAGKSGSRTALSLMEIQQLARFLANVPGRKNVIWFAGSFPVEIFPSSRVGNSYSREMQENVNLLNKDRVSIYPVSVGGLDGLAAFEAGNNGHVAGPIRRQYASKADDQIAMQELARDSGGHAFMNTNDLSAAISHAVSDGAHYYTLTYTPTNKEENGKYRKIEVKLDRGYSVSYRRGYYAEDAKSAMASPAPPSDRLLPLLQLGTPDSSQILYSMRVLPVNPQPAPDAPHAGDNLELKGPVTRYRAEFAIAEKDLRLDPAPDGTRHGQLELMMVAYNRDGKPLNLLTRKADLALTPAEYERFKGVGLQMQSEIDIPPGDSVLRTGIYDLQSNLAGTLAVPLSAEMPSTAAPKPVPASAR